MAVSYSDYKFAIIASGSENGTWGDYTNDNFQYAVQQAIGGLANLSFVSTSYTLSASNNNALQDFRALYLNCTGTPGGAATLTVPAIQKTYIVKNGTTGGHNITVKIGASTGTVVPNGKTMILYANGTDVIATSDYFASVGSAGNASFGGTLSVTGNSTLSGDLTSGTSTTTSGTYSRVTNTITITSTAHGFLTGQVLYLNFTSGAATTGVYTITVVNANTFTVTDTVSGSTSGNVSIIKYNNTWTLNTPIVLPAAFGSSGTLNQVLISQGSGVPPRWETPAAVAGNWSIGGNLTVTGTSTFTGASTFNGNTTVGSTTVTSGTYGRSTTTVTVTSNAHGFSNGQVLYLVFSAGTGGTATSGVYAISNVATNTFDITDTASGTITGSPAVSITKYNNTATLQAPLSSFGSVGTSGFVLTSQGTGAPPQWSAAPVTSVNNKTGAIQSVLTQYASVTASALTINTTSGSPTITVTAGTAQVGQILSSTNLPAGTYITAFVSGSNWTVSANASATATGTAATVVGFAFTGVPSWVKRITVMLNGPTGGAQNLGMRIGTGTTPTYVTTGYIAGANDGGGAVNATTYFPLTRRGTPSASDNWSGSLQLTNLSGNFWTESGTLGSSGGGSVCSSGGVVDAGAALTAVQILYNNFSTTAFTGGTVNIMYE